MLVDDLRLPFDRVSTKLDAISAADPRWWVLGKLYAYREQERPFLHIDSDAYLWKNLRPSLLRAEIAAQNPEWAPPTDQTYYKPRAFVETMTAHDGWLPEEWLTYFQRGGDVAICAGILGGCAVDLLRQYADRAISIVERNRLFWNNIDTVEDSNVLLEQYYCAAFLDHQGHARGTGIELEYLFPSEEDALDSRISSRVGFTHLIAGAKRNKQFFELVSRRVNQDFPQFSAHIVNDSC